MKKLSEQKLQASRKAHTAGITAALMRSAKRAQLTAHRPDARVVIMQDGEVVETKPIPEMYGGLTWQYKSLRCLSQVELNKRDNFTYAFPPQVKLNKRDAFICACLLFIHDLFYKPIVARINQSENIEIEHLGRKAP